MSAQLAAARGVEIAGINGPRQVVLSGDEAAVSAAAQHWAAQGRRGRVQSGNARLLGDAGSV